MISDLKILEDQAIEVAVDGEHCVVKGSVVTMSKNRS